MKLQQMIQQNIVKPLDYLKEDQELCRQVQICLKDVGLLPANEVDGIYGPQTEQAFHEFKKRVHEGEPNELGAGTAKLLIETKTLPGGNDLISKSQAEYIYGNVISPEQFSDLNSCLNRFQINTPPTMRNFLSQTAEESGGLKWMKELASGDAYNGRKDLGNIYPGDGPKYKGAGVLQLTGRDNYQAFANYMHNPKIMEGVNYVSVVYPFTSGGFWWHNNNMNKFCNDGATVEQVTRRVNGGLNGLATREAYYQKALKIFPG